MKILALVIFIITFEAVVGRCEQQAAGSGGVGTMLGGVVI